MLEGLCRTYDWAHGRIAAKLTQKARIMALCLFCTRRGRKLPSLGARSPTEYPSLCLLFFQARLQRRRRGVTTTRQVRRHRVHTRALPIADRSPVKFAMAPRCSRPRFSLAPVSPERCVQRKQGLTTVVLKRKQKGVETCVALAYPL